VQLPARLVASSKGDRVMLMNVSNSMGPVHFWEASTDSFTTWYYFDFTEGAAMSADGNRAWAYFRFLEPDGAGGLDETGGAAYNEMLWEQYNVYGLAGRKFHPSGSFIYLPLNIGLDILDAHTGVLRDRIRTPAQLPGSRGSAGFLVRPIALDEHGRRVFAITTSGLAIIDLGAAPLGIGSITPDFAPYLTAQPVVIRGSGFTPSTQVLFRDQVVPSEWIDESTIHAIAPALYGSVPVTVSNGAGMSYTVDAAFQYGPRKRQPDKPLRAKTQEISETRPMPSEHPRPKTADATPGTGHRPLHLTRGDPY